MLKVENNMGCASRLYNWHERVIGMTSFVSREDSETLSQISGGMAVTSKYDVLNKGGEWSPSRTASRSTHILVDTPIKRLRPSVGDIIGE